MNSLVQRVVSLIKSPKTEWPVIAGEPATVGSLYMPYVLVLAAIGPLASLLGGGGFGMFRFSGSLVLRTALWQYAVSLIAVALFALVINVLAPTFGGAKDTTQSFKTAVYASTASWLAGVGVLLGFSLGGLISLAGLAYSIYLLYLALPHTMKAPVGKATGYTVAIIVACIVLGAGLFFLGRATGIAGGLASVSRPETPTFDPDSPMGRLEQAGREIEKAEQQGKLNDPSAAVAAAMGALAGSKGAVEALPADTLKAFLPETLAGLPRQRISAERNGVMGMQVANASARYGDGSRTISLEITDTGGAAGLVALAGGANIEESSEEGTRTERTGREGDSIVHEVWDSATRRGEYTRILGNRFIVKAEGEAASLAELKSAAGEIDLARLESLKGQGIKP